MIRGKTGHYPRPDKIKSFRRTLPLFFPAFDHRKQPRSFLNPSFKQAKKNDKKKFRPNSYLDVMEYMLGDRYIVLSLHTDRLYIHPYFHILYERTNQREREREKVHFRDDHSPPPWANLYASNEMVWPQREREREDFYGMICFFFSSFYFYISVSIWSLCRLLLGVQKTNDVCMVTTDISMVHSVGFIEKDYFLK